MKLSLCFTLFCCLSFASFAQTPNNNVHVPWLPNDPCCDKIVVDGSTIRTIKRGDITVAVSASRYNDFYAFEVTVFNDSKERILVDPVQSGFWIVKEGDKPVPVKVKRLDPDKLAAKYRTHAMWANALRTFGAAMSNDQITTYGSTSGTASVYSSGGYRKNVRYSGTVSTTTTTPNYEARRQAARQNAETSAEAQSQGSYVQSIALRANTVFPQQDVWGNVLFEIKKAERGIFGILVDGSQFEFAYTLK